jgi:hypothetical protein
MNDVWAGMWKADVMVSFTFNLSISCENWWKKGKFTLGWHIPDRIWNQVPLRWIGFLSWLSSMRFYIAFPVSGKYWDSTFKEPWRLSASPLIAHHQMSWWSGTSGLKFRTWAYKPVVSKVINVNIIPFPLISLPPHWKISYRPNLT